jgi:hypothetical protein
MVIASLPVPIFALWFGIFRTAAGLRRLVHPLVMDNQYVFSSRPATRRGRKRDREDALPRLDQLSVAKPDYD